MDNKQLLEDYQQKNRELIGRNAILQKQFDDALDITKSFNTISSKNSELEKQIHSYKAKNDDLNRRVLILSQANSELSQKLDEEKQNNLSRSRSDISSLQDKLRQQQCDHEKEVIELNNKILNANQINKNSIECLKTQFQRIFDAATQCFGTPISETDVLVSLLLTKSQCHPSLQSPHVIINEAPYPGSPSKRLVRAHVDYTEGEIASKKEIKAEIKSVKTKNHKMKQIIKEQTDSMKNIMKERNELQKIISQMNSQLDQAQQQIDELNHSAKQVKELFDKNTKLKSQLSSSKHKISTFEKQDTVNKEIIGKLKESIDKKDKEINQLSKVIQQNQEKQSIIENNFNDLRSKYQELSDSVQNDKNAFEEKKAEANNCKNAFQSLQKVMDSQKQELITLQTQRLKLISQIQILNSSLSQYEQSVTSLLSKKGEKLSTTVFVYPKFPSGLKELIAQISWEEETKEEDKVKNVLSAIFDYYNGQITHLSDEIRTRRLEMEQEKQRLFNIMANLNRKLPQNEELTNNNESFISGSATTISEYIDNLQNIQEVLLQKDAEKENELNEFFRLLNVSSYIDAKTNISHLLNENQQLTTKLQEKKEKALKLEQEHIQHQNEIQEKMSIVKNTLSKTEIKMKENENAWYCERNKLSNKIKELVDLDESNKEHIIHLKKQFSEKIKKDTDALNKLETQLSKQQNEIEQQCNTNNELQKDSDKKDIVIQQLRSFTKYFAKKQSQKYKSEQDLLKNQLNQIIEQLKQKNVELKKNLGEVRNKMNTSDQQYAKAKQQISEYLIKIQQLEIKLESYQCDAERGKSLIESKAKASLIAQETEFQSHLEDSKWQIENAKREIMAYVGLQFSSLFNAKVKIDSTNFESFIQNLKQKFDQLKSEDSNIRQMLSLGPGDSVQSAISNLLYLNNL